MAEQKSTKADTANGGSTQSKGVIALIVLACICSVLALTLTWVRNQTLDTDRYVKTVAPLATNKAIQSAVTDALTNELVKAVKPEQLVKKSLPSQAAPLAGPIAQAVQGFARTVILKLVESKQFAKLWEVISRRSLPWRRLDPGSFSSRRPEASRSPIQRRRHSPRPSTTRVSGSSSCSASAARRWRVSRSATASTG